MQPQTRDGSSNAEPNDLRWCLQALPKLAKTFSNAYHVFVREAQ